MRFNANPQQIQRYLRGKGSPLAAHAGAFVRAGQQYGVDPRFLVAIAGSETSFGTYGPSQRIHNPFGWGPHIKFGSYPEAINTIAKGLATGPHYKTKGRTTIPQIAGTWAPVGASNDPTGLNNNWTKNVSAYYRELGGNPNAPVFGNAGGAPAPQQGQGQQRPTAGGQGNVAMPRPDARSLMAMLQQQSARALSGQMPTADFGQQLQRMASSYADRANAYEQAGVATVQPPGQMVPANGFTPGGFIAGGGPDAHASRALGNWQSDHAYDIMGKAGQAVHLPTKSRVIKISGSPGGNPQFAGYGVTLGTPRGQVFVKHLGSLGPNVKVGSQLPAGAFLGGLDARTGGGPHIHLGAQNRGFLDWLNAQYLGRG